MTGSFKDVASQLLHRFLTYRAARINGPHICEILPKRAFISLNKLTSNFPVYAVLNFCFTHPNHRRRGAGRLLMEWGTKKADELGLTSYIESTESGRPLYEAQGFYVEGDIDLDATTDNPSEEFTRMREKLGCPIHGWFMRRPSPGKAE